MSEHRKLRVLCLASCREVNEKRGGRFRPFLLRVLKVYYFFADFFVVVVVVVCTGV